jgi:tetratricopeptide (TPR) repeat protein
VEELEPDALKARTFQALRHLLLALSRRDPLVAVVEDLQWMDGVSEEFLASFADAVAAGRVLLVSTYRPGYRPPWLDRSYATQVALSPLAPADSERIARAALAGRAIDDALVERIVERAEGNPFFLEELARAVREQGDATTPVAVPDTVQGVLLGRIDRLDPDDRRLLQVAAVVGKDVPLGLLQAVAELPAPAFWSGLGRLKAAEFLYETTASTEPEFTFRHALTHEVAYASLSPEDRRACHARVVEAIEGLGAERVAVEIERLAHHAFHGGLRARAVTYLRQAGARAAARSAHREAVLRFEQALEALAQLPPARERQAEAIDIRFDLRNSLLPLGEVDRGLECLREAEALAVGLEDARRLAQLSVYLTGQLYLRGEHAQAWEAGQRALAIGRALDDVGLRVSTHAYLGQVSHARGDYRGAAAFFRDNVEALVGARAHERFGLPQLPSVHSRTCLVWSLAELGEFAEAFARGDEAVAIAELVDQPLSRTVAYAGLGAARLRAGDVEGAIAILERALDLCDRWHIPIWVPRVASSLGVAYAQAGRIDAGLALAARAVERAEAMMLVGGLALLVACRAEAALAGGRVSEGSALAARALALAREHGERGYEAASLRLLAEAARVTGDLPGAVRAGEAALALATELGMRPLVGQCLLGLGRALRRSGEGEDAARRLSAARALFGELGMAGWRARSEAALAGED